MEGRASANGCHDLADHGTDSDVDERLEIEARHPARPSAQLQQQRDVSAMLGEKMLQGWTLLGDTCPRCSTILVRNRDRELFCVSCDMFLRPEQQAPAPTVAPLTTGQEDSAQTGHAQHAKTEEETHNSSGENEEEAACLEPRSASYVHGCDRLLALMMETMELLAEQLKRDVKAGDCRGSTFIGLLDNIESVATTYHSIRTKCG